MWRFTPILACQPQQSQRLRQPGEQICQAAMPDRLDLKACLRGGRCGRCTYGMNWKAS
jgi:hypothetical protein